MKTLLNLVQRASLGGIPPEAFARDLPKWLRNGLGNARISWSFSV